MLEGLAASILTKYLGNYVQGLMKDNLRLSLGLGDAVLENLEFKPEALDELELPIKVKAGFLGELRLKIPWKNLQSRPAIITIDRVFLIAGPKSLTEHDEIAAAKRRQRAKLQKLQVHEYFSSQSNEETMVAKAKERADSLGKWMLTKVIDNLQVFINNVHIRYEDDQSDPQHPFAMGITLEHLHAQSTNERWEPVFLQTEPELAHKLVTLKNLAIYWDPDVRPYNPSNNQEMGAFLEKLIFRDDVAPPDLHYVLQPISGELKLVMKKSDVPDAKLTPKYSLNFQFEQISCSLEEFQYRDIMALLERFTQYSKAQRFKGVVMRPEVSPKADPVAWWHYASQASLFEKKEKTKQWSWQNITQAKKDQQEYIELFIKKKRLKKGLSIDDKERLENLETKLDYDTIIMFRSIAEAYLAKETETVATLRDEAKKKAEEQSQESYWFVRKLKNTVKNLTGIQEEKSVPEVQLTPEMMKELYSQVVGQSGVTLENGNGNNLTSSNANGNANELVPKEYVRTKIKFTLSRGLMELKNSPTLDTFAKGTFNDFHILVEAREGSQSFSADVKSVGVVDYHTQNTRYPWIIAPQRKRRVQSNSNRVDEDEEDEDEFYDDYFSDEDEDDEDEEEERTTHGRDDDDDEEFEDDEYPTVSGGERSSSTMTHRMSSDVGRSSSSSSSSVLTSSSKTHKLLMKQERARLRREKTYFFCLSVDVNPLNSTADYRVDMYMKPLDIVCSRAFMDRIVSFFSYGTRKQSDLSAVAINRLEELRQLTTAQLYSALENHKSVELKIDIHAPNIVIPENYQDHTSLLVVELGKISITSDPQNTNDNEALLKKSSDKSDFVQQELLYDKFHLSMTSLQVFFTNELLGEWANKEVPAEMQIVERFDVNFLLEICKLKSENLVQTRVSGNLPSLKSYISPMKYLQLSNILRNIFRARKAVSVPTAQRTYHFVEVEEISATNSATKDASKPITTTPVSGGKNSNKQLFSLQFQVPEVSFIFQHTPIEGKKTQNLAILSLKDLSGTYLNTKHFTTASITLRELLLEDKIQTFGPEFAYLANSNPPNHDLALEPSKTTALIKVSYRHTPKRSPLYELIDNEVDFTFNSLYITSNRETIAALRKFNEEIFVTIQKFQTDGDIPTAEEAVLPVKYVPPNLSTSSSTAASITCAASSLHNTLEPRHCQLKLTATLNFVGLALNKDGKVLSNWSLRNMKSDVMVYSKSLEMHGELGDVGVEYLYLPYDHHEAHKKEEGKEEGKEEEGGGSSFYSCGCGKEILKMDRGADKTKSLVSFSFLTFDPCDSKRHYDALFRLNMSSCRFVYLHEFLTEISVYFREMEDMEAFVSSTATNAAFVARSAAANKKLFGYEVQLTNPYIIFPKHATSEEEIRADLGLITISNGFHYSAPETTTSSSSVSATPNDAILETFYASVTALNVKSAMAGETPEKAAAIVENTDMKIAIDYPFSAPSHVLPDQTVTIEIPTISIVLSQAQAQLIFDTVTENACDPVSLHKVLEMYRAKRERRKDQEGSDPADQHQLAESVYLSHKMNVKLQQFSMDFYRTEHLPPGSSQLPMLTLFADDFEIHLDTFSDYSMDGDFYFDSVVFTDTRGSGNQFKDIVTPRANTNLPRPSDDGSSSGSPTNRQVHVKYRREPSGFQDAAVVWDNAYAVVIPDAWLYGWYYIRQLRDKTFRTYDVYQDYLNQTAEFQKPPWEWATWDLRVRVTFTNPELYMLPDSSELNTKAFVVKSKFAVTYRYEEQTTIWQLNAEHLETYKCRVIQEALTSNSVVEPFGLNLEYAYKDDDWCSLICFETVNVAFSYNDFCMFSQIVQYWMKVYYAPLDASGVASLEPGTPEYLAAVQSTTPVNYDSTDDDSDVDESSELQDPQDARPESASLLDEQSSNTTQSSSEQSQQSRQVKKKEPAKSRLLKFLSPPTQQGSNPAGGVRFVLHYNQPTKKRREQTTNKDLHETSSTSTGNTSGRVLNLRTADDIGRLERRESKLKEWKERLEKERQDREKREEIVRQQRERARQLKEQENNEKKTNSTGESEGASNPVAAASSSATTMLVDDSLQEFDVTAPLLEFIDQLLSDPSTFLDFPYDEFAYRINYDVSEKHMKHAVHVSIKMSRLIELQHRVVQTEKLMTEETFWKIYFYYVTCAGFFTTKASRALKHDPLRTLKWWRTTGFKDASRYPPEDLTSQNRDDILQWRRIAIPNSRENAQKELKMLIHKSGVPDFKRRSVWLAVTGATDFAQKNPDFYKKAMYRTFGDRIERKRYTDVPLFGGNFGPRDHYLTLEGIEVAKRILCVIRAEHPEIVYAAVLPDLVMTCLHFMNEPETYTMIHLMLMNNKFYFNLSQKLSTMFVKNYVSSLKKLSPKLGQRISELHLQQKFRDTVERWFCRLFVGALPFRTLVRVLDGYMCEGSKMLYKVGLALMQMFSDVLFFSQSAEEFVKNLRDCAMHVTGPPLMKNALALNERGTLLPNSWISSEKNAIPTMTFDE